MSDDSVFLHGVALANYRGIGKDPVYVGPFRRFNFMIGPNNAGKSCVLHFIANGLNQYILEPRNVYGGKFPALPPLDIHVKSTPHEVKLGIGVPSRHIVDHLNELLSGRNPFKHGNIKDCLNNAVSILAQDDIIWLTRKPNENKLSPFLKILPPEEIAKKHRHNDWKFLWECIRVNVTGGSINQWIGESLDYICNQADIKIPKINLIPAIREISSKGHEFASWDGVGLIDKLAHLQNPGSLERDLRIKFDQVNQFLQAVTQNASAKIEIPHDREHVLVDMDGKVLPLSSLGTGIHEVVMLAAFCTLMENQIVCIEEPEIHLHPLLQRRLIQYLQEKTNNQYFIATHSASLIDTPDAAIFHVTNHEGTTRISPAVSTSDKFAICSDLGYRASDILQANAVIWVEGPSDRIYIRHWISELAPELREGIDYSIMFYGGRLLSHLSTNDPETIEADLNALIAVRSLNRNLAVVIDSDRAKSGARINETKRRIRDELEGNEEIAWITTGREIENYVAPDLMKQALLACYPDFAKQEATDQYDHVLPFKTKSGKVITSPDKVKIAKEVCRHPADLDVLDLRKQVTQLVQMIQKANEK